ncbi:MAG: hypothetical protein ACOY3D_06650 [Candidatus Omnitrophota bacterium]
MNHTLNLKSEQKLNIWLDLCDLTFEFLRNNLKPMALKRRLKKIRLAHLKEDCLVLSRLAKLK